MATETATKQGSNLSFVLHKPGHVSFEERPIPELKDPHDVLVNIKVTGICGSDVHYYTHGAIGQFVVKDPMVLGHESAGVVTKVGSAVKSVKEGDEVALEPGIPCRRCTFCRSGFYNLCDEVVFAATPPYNGTLTGYYSVPEDFCYKLPKGVSLDEGALVEPLSVAVHIVKQADVKPGQSVVVMGAGPVGLLCCAVAGKAYGAGTIVSVDIVPHRLDFAKRYAANETYIPSKDKNAEENAKALLAENGLEGGADVVIDASGAEPSIQTAIHTLRKGGTYVQGGMGKNDITFPIMAMCTKELNVKGSFRYGSGDYALAIELLRSGKLSVKELITGRVAFENAEEAFEKVRKGEGIKILIEGSKR